MGQAPASKAHGMSSLIALLLILKTTWLPIQAYVLLK